MSWLMFEAQFRARRAMKWVGIHAIPESVAHRFGRFMCTRFEMHGLSCRGRSDHYTAEQCGWHPALERWYL